LLYRHRRTTLDYIDHNGHSDRYDLVEIAMITETSAVAFRQNLGEMLNQVQYRKDSIVVKRDGKPVAALVDAELFARINRIRDRFDDLANRIAEDYAQTPVEIGLAEIDAAVAAQRAQ